MSSDGLAFLETPTIQVATELLGCLRDAMDDVCSVGLTFGSQYIPFRPDEADLCEDDDSEEGICSQVWLRVSNLAPDQSTGFGPAHAISFGIGIEVGVTRCYEITEEGEAPTSIEVTAGALIALSDANRIYCAVIDCFRHRSDLGLTVRPGTWSPIGPQGGQHGGVWTFTIEE